jgi:hypothetical protein
MITRRFLNQFIAAVAVTAVFAGLLAFVHFSERVSQDQLGPGVRHVTYELEGPFRVDLIEIDRRRADANIVAWRSGGLVPTTRQVADARREGRDVIGAVNADFFSFQSTLPIGNQVTDGLWVYGTGSRRSHVMVDEAGNVLYDAVSFNGSVVGPNGVVLSLTGVNRHRANDQVMFYNYHYGCERSRSDSTGVELVLRLLQGEQWLAGVSTRVVVDEVAAGDAGLWEGVVIISAGQEHPDYAGFSRLSVADTLELMLGLNNGAYSGIRQMIGGGGRILRDGQNVSAENIATEGIGEAFLTNRHPRTFVASDREGQRIWLGTVDGRQAASLGMNFDEMAAFLLDLGAWDAVNLDGGGSTTMVVADSVANRPSDATGERAVANILFVERVAGQ